MTYDEQIEIIQWARDGNSVEVELRTGWEVVRGKSFNFVDFNYRKVIEPREWTILICSKTNKICSVCDDNKVHICKGSNTIKVKEVS